MYVVVKITRRRCHGLILCKCVGASLRVLRNHVWLVDLNTGACRDCGQKHGKREKFRRQPSENVPYKAADAAREEGQGSKGCTRRAGNYVSGRPFVRLQSTTAQVLRETGAFLQRARREEKGRQGKSERESCKERPRPCASMTRNEATKECREKRRTDSAAVNIPGIRPVSKCTLGMRLA